MTSRVVLKEAMSGRKSLCGIILIVVLSLGWFAPQAFSKEPSLTAIALYDGPTGAAYVQLGEVLINGKAELRDCSQAQGAAIDKSVYGKLPKTMLAVGGVLERGADGVLRYSANSGAAICVVPANVKFEHNASFSLSDLAEQAALRGTPVAPSGDLPSGVPPLKKGVKLVFVAAPNIDLAEFLRAQRASDIAVWRAFIAKYPASPHTADSKLALALLYVAAGEKSLNTYQQSAATASPSYADLKSAKSQADLARALLPSLDTVAKLGDEIRGKLAAITDKARGELDAYHAALTAHAPGYVHLQNAKSLSDAVAGIDAEFAPGQVLLRDVLKDNGTYESALQSATSAVSAKQMDRAFAAIQPYRAFATEDSRLGAQVDAIYGYHMDRGAEAGQAIDWKTSIAEFEKAESTKDTPEALAALKNAREQFVVAQDAAAVRAALERSKAFEEEKDMLQAYETLSTLPASQRALVSDDLKRLAPAYVLSAVQASKDRRKAHEPIQGIGDGFEIENAYAYLQRAFDLQPDDTFQDTMSYLGEELSTYFLSQAKHYLEKPEGSGTELGWAYLQEALSYKASNQAAVRDARVGAEAAHAMHSKLSIEVQFRDSTSLRDSPGFASQLENAIITGMEASAIPIKAIRFGESTSVKPDYRLTGDVLQHHISDTPTIESLQSQFFASERDEPNDKWNKANRDYEAATLELQSAQSALQGVMVKGNKKVIAENQKKVTDDQKKVSNAHVLLDAIPKSLKVPINQPYNYTRKTIDYNEIIQLQFRIGESLNGQMMDVVPISKEGHSQTVVLEGVKAEDTQGVKPKGTIPDKNEMLAGLENTARDALIDAVRARVEALPGMIFAGAKKKEEDGDVEGAAEAYLRYLHCTPENGSVERKHALVYLKSQYHLQSVSSISN